MVADSQAEARAPVIVRCTVSSLQPGMTEFGAQFCQELTNSLTRILGTPFELASSGREGRAVTVEARVASINRADVTIAFGQLAGGDFQANSTITRSLTSFDRPLSPASARTLVRDIGLGMGLVQ